MHQSQFFQHDKHVVAERLIQMCTWLQWCRNEQTWGKHLPVLQTSLLIRPRFNALLFWSVHWCPWSLYRALCVSFSIHAFALYPPANARACQNQPRRSQSIQRKPLIPKTRILLDTKDCRIQRRWKLQWLLFAGAFVYSLRRTVWNHDGRPELELASRRHLGRLCHIW